jgi:eukaryotic-like serine/threonine-protein kinase
MRVEMSILSNRPGESNAEEAEMLAAGTLLGAYRIVRCIGSGGMGAVYEAEHSALQKRVALKVPCLSGLSEEGRARFVREGRTALRIRHPHVVDITDVGEAEDVAYLVMEYLEGQPLSALLDGKGRLDPAMIADIFVPVAAALEEAHRMGIIHRDLKPDNIFITRTVHERIHPKVLDFGISKLVDDVASPPLTGTNTLLGTPRYLSPEQLQSARSATARSDQYSLGVVMYEAATGTNPFAGHDSLMSVIRAIGDGRRPRAKQVYPELEERLRRIIERAMSVSPAGRFESMLSLGAQLLPLASADTQRMWARYFGLAEAVSPARSLKTAARWFAVAGAAALLGAAAVRIIALDRRWAMEVRPVRPARGVAMLDISDPPRRGGPPEPPPASQAPVPPASPEPTPSREHSTPLLESPRARARVGKQRLVQNGVTPIRAPARRGGTHRVSPAAVRGL